MNLTFGEYNFVYSKGTFSLLKNDYMKWCLVFWLNSNGVMRIRNCIFSPTYLALKTKWFFLYSCPYWKQNIETGKDEVWFTLECFGHKLNCYDGVWSLQKIPYITGKMVY